jgi:uncharacterized membrane protein YhaH (DUF805 family)
LGGVVFGIAGTWIALATYAKHWHDLDKSGWMTLTLLIPLVNLLIVLFLSFAPGTAGTNKYGKAPGSSGSNSKIISRLLQQYHLIFRVF